MNERWAGFLVCLPLALVAEVRPGATLDSARPLEFRAEHHSPGNPNARPDPAARLIVAAVADRSGTGKKSGTRLGVEGSRFTTNGQPIFLYGISYYGALGASEDFIRRDLDDAQRNGFNWIRVWATWASFGQDVSAVDAEGHPREPYMTKLKGLAADCDRRGLVLDLSLSRGNGVSGPSRLKTHEAHHRAVETLVNALKPWRNWYLDLSNERNIKDQRYTSIEELKALRELVRRLDPQRLVTASHAGDIARDELSAYVQTVRVDFIAPHRPRDAGSPAQTESKTREYLAWMTESGRVVPVHHQEPFRRDFGRWNPRAADYVTDFRGARAGGAAGWCLHNGDARDKPDGQPRRSFGMTEKRLFDQLDEEERQAIEQIKSVAGARP